MFYLVNHSGLGSIKNLGDSLLELTLGLTFFPLDRCDDVNNLLTAIIQI